MSCAARTRLTARPRTRPPCGCSTPCLTKQCTSVLPPHPPSWRRTASPFRASYTRSLAVSRRSGRSSRLRAAPPRPARLRPSRAHPLLYRRARPRPVLHWRRRVERSHPLYQFSPFTDLRARPWTHDSDILPMARLLYSSLDHVPLHPYLCLLCLPIRVSPFVVCFHFAPKVRSPRYRLVHVGHTSPLLFSSALPALVFAV